MLDLTLSFNAAADVTFNVYAADNSVLEDPTGPDSIEITSQPARGHVVALPNGKMSFNHNNDLTTTPLSFTYDRTTGVVTTPVTATIVLATPIMTGWEQRGYYLPPVDYSVSHLAFAWPGETSRLIHADADSLLTFDAIRLAEAGISDTADVQTVANWIADNPATGQGGKYYGQTPALALEQELAERTYFAVIRDERFTSPWLLYKRGGVYGTISRSFGAIGESKVHPIKIGAYGTGDPPFFTFKGPDMASGAYLLMQGLEYSDSLDFNDLSYGVSDYMKARGNSATNSSTHLTGGSSGKSFARDITVRGLRAFDCSTQYPGAGRTVWADLPDRSSAMFGQWCLGMLVEECHIDMSGWDNGHHPTRLYTDGVSFWPHGPDVYSHGFYFDSSVTHAHFRNSWITRPSGAAFQARAGALVHGVHLSFANLGDTIGGGWFATSNDINGRRITSWSFVDRLVKTKAGFKNYFTSPISSDSGGFQVRVECQSTFRMLVGSPGDPDPYITGTELGPHSHPGGPRNFFPIREESIFDGIPPGPARPFVNCTQFLWNRANYPDFGTNGLNDTQLGLITIEKYAETLLGAGATYYDLVEHLRTLDVPSDLIDGAIRFFLSPFGAINSASRTTPQTCTFQPFATGTPGCRMDIPIDWDTDDLPGTVAGDNADLGDHIGMQGSFNPRNKITDLSFRDLLWNGGCMDLLGDTILPAGGGTLEVEGGAHFYMNDKTGGTLGLTVKEGVFVNRGDLDDANIECRFGSLVILADEGKSLTIDSGRTLTVHGHAQVGFDGAAGGTATLTLSSGGKVVFKPCIKVPITVASMTDSPAFVFAPSSSGNGTTREMLPKIGATVTGANGSTGRCVDVLFGNSANTYLCWVYLDNLAGVPAFVGSEVLTADCDLMYTYDMGVQDFGAVNTAAIQPASMGCIKKIRSGRRGFDPNGWVYEPDVNSVVVLDGADLDVHIGMLGNVTDLVLIEADTITHNFDFGTVTVYGHQVSGSEKDVTIDVTATQILLTIANAAGGGSVTVNYPA